MTWRTNTSGNCEFVDDGWCSFVGRSTESQLGQGWLSCVHRNDRNGLITRLHQLRDTRLPFFVAYRLRHHSGHYLEVMARAHPWVLDGEFRGHYGAVFERSTGLPLQEAGHLLTFRAKQWRAVLAHHGSIEDAMIKNV